MTPELLRSLWRLIELLPPDTLTHEDLDSFLDLLMAQLQEQHTLDASQVRLARLYIEQRMPLVYELNEPGQFSRSQYLSA